jgi:hypothetical protein
VSRDAIDRAAIDGVDVIEVPGAHARPPVLVPRDEMAIALRLHAASYEKHAAPLYADGRLSRASLDGVAAQVCRALDAGPLAMGDIRRAVTHPDAGALLVGALVGLTVRGVVRRYPVDGRLDAAKYVYELRHPDDRPDLDAEGDGASVLRKAVRLFLARHGPATVDEMSWWAASTKGAIRKALSALGAEPVRIANGADEPWILPDDLKAWRSFEADDANAIALLPNRDPYVHVRRPPMVLSGDGNVPVLNARLKPVGIREIGVLHHHTVVAGGTLAGVWEYDPDSRSVRTRVWSRNRRFRREVSDAAEALGRYIRAELGDAKLSAVDPPEQRARRIAFCGGEP